LVVVDDEGVLTRPFTKEIEHSLFLAIGGEKGMEHH
jgi:hypothetical protein